MEDKDKKCDGEQGVETWVDLVSLVNKIDSLEYCIRYQGVTPVIFEHIPHQGQTESAEAHARE